MVAKQFKPRIFVLFFHDQILDHSTILQPFIVFPLKPQIFQRQRRGQGEENEREVLALENGKLKSRRWCDLHAPRTTGAAGAENGTPKREYAEVAPKASVYAPCGNNMLKLFVAFQLFSIRVRIEIRCRQSYSVPLHLQQRQGW